MNVMQSQFGQGLLGTQAQVLQQLVQRQRDLELVEQLLLIRLILLTDHLKLRNWGQKFLQEQ